MKSRKRDVLRSLLIRKHVMRQDAEEAGAIDVFFPVVRFSHAAGGLEQMDVLGAAATGADVTQGLRAASSVEEGIPAERIIALVSRDENFIGLRGCVAELLPGGECKAIEGCRDKRGAERRASFLVVFRSRGVREAAAGQSSSAQEMQAAGDDPRAETVADQADGRLGLHAAEAIGQIIALRLAIKSLGLHVGSDVPADPRTGPGPNDNSKGLPSWLLFQPAVDWPSELDGLVVGGAIAMHEKNMGGVLFIFFDKGRRRFRIPLLLLIEPPICNPRFSPFQIARHRRNAY